MRACSTAAGALLLCLLAAGCGGAPPAADPSSAATGATSGASGDVGADPASAAPLAATGPEVPPIADPLACDGDVVRCVAPGGTGEGTQMAPFGRIQDALDQAGPGTVVQVAAGGFDEHLVVPSGVALRGGFALDLASRPEDAVTTVTGLGEGPTVLLDVVEDVEVEGFTLTGGTGLCTEGQCDGGGIAADGSGIRLLRNRIVGNRLPAERESNGGGIAARGQVLIAGNVIEQNRAGNGAGIIADGDVELIGNVIRDNVSAGDHGGGAFLTGTLVVRGNLVEGNRVGESLGYGWGGGIIVASEGTTFMASGNTYRANHAVIGGGGLFVDDGADGSVIGELLVANTCEEEEARGALYIDALDASGDTGSVVEVVNATIADNHCGAGINVEAAGSAAAISRSVIVGNGGPPVATAAGGTAEVRDSLADQALAGPGNVVAEPVFDDGYRLVEPADRPELGAFGTRPVDY